jgi:predicted DNA-binding transcriptional regulator
MLEAVGVTKAEEQVYRVLLDHPHATLGEITAALRITGGHARRVLASLEAKGMVARSPGPTTRFSPAPPDLAVESLIMRKQHELEQARAAATLMVDDFVRGSRAPGTARIVDLVEGRDAVRLRFQQLEAAVNEELFLIDKPPYAVVPTGPNQAELELLANGVRCRVLYDSSSFEVPGKLDWLAQCVAAGEEARVLSDLPAKVDIADRRLAMVFETDATTVDSAVVVHPSALLDALMTMTEDLWARAVPVPVGPTTEHEIDYPLLTLMAAGVKDAAIARQLGVSVRTVHRRVAALMDALGADTRFHAGVQAGRLGWLDERHASTSSR